MCFFFNSFVQFNEYNVFWAGSLERMNADSRTLCLLRPPDKSSQAANLCDWIHCFSLLFLRPCCIHFALGLSANQHDSRSEVTEALKLRAVVLRAIPLLRFFIWVALSHRKQLGIGTAKEIKSWALKKETCTHAHVHTETHTHTHCWSPEQMRERKQTTHTQAVVLHLCSLREAFTGKDLAQLVQPGTWTFR